MPLDQPRPNVVKRAMRLDLLEDGGAGTSPLHEHVMRNLPQVTVDSQAPGLSFKPKPALHQSIEGANRDSA
eukprot:10621950-Alexandrium_andersonii.AAC.1